MMITYIQTKMVYKSPLAYLAMIPGIFSGKYLAIKLLISFKVLYFIKVKILKNISNIATKNTTLENLLKKQITITNKTIKIIASTLTLPILSNILSKNNLFRNIFLNTFTKKKKYNIIIIRRIYE